MVDRTAELAYETLRGELPGEVALPATADAGAVAVAGWRRGGFGAVLIVRRWKNGVLVHDVVPCRQDSGGEWESPAHGGSPLADPSAPVSAGTVEWFAGYSTTFSDDDDEIEFNMLVGVAAPDVRGLRVETADERYEHPVHHPPGLVVIAAVDPALITALDARQRAMTAHRWSVPRS